MAKKPARARPVSTHRGKGDGASKPVVQNPAPSVHKRVVATKRDAARPKPPPRAQHRPGHAW